MNVAREVGKPHERNYSGLVFFMLKNRRGKEKIENTYMRDASSTAYGKRRVTGGITLGRHSRLGQGLKTGLQHNRYLTRIQARAINKLGGAN